MYEQDEPHVDAAERELEVALRGLKPGPAALDPIACAFEAGRKTASRRASAWRSTASALLLLLLASIFIPTERQDGRNSANEGNFATAVSLPRATNTNHPTYLTTRDAVLDRGVDVLPASAGVAEPVSLHGM